MDINPFEDFCLTTTEEEVDSVDWESTIYDMLEYIKHIVDEKEDENE